MTNQAIGMMEYKTVSCGVAAADMMVKTAEIELMEASAVCPGKYMILVSGSISAVRAALDAAAVRYEGQLIDSFMLGNPHPSIFNAIFGTAVVEHANALGVLETYSCSAAIVAADTSAKTAAVDLIDLRLARGLCGKSYLFITGEVAAVQMAVERAKAQAAESGMFLDSAVIPNPDPKLWQRIL